MLGCILRLTQPIRHHVDSRLLVLQGGKQAGKATPAGAKVGSPLGPNGQQGKGAAQQGKGAGRIDMGKAGSIACLEELEEAGKKKQMAEWSSDRYAARSARSLPP